MRRVAWLSRIGLLRISLRSVARVPWIPVLSAFPLFDSFATAVAAAASSEFDADLADLAALEHEVHPIFPLTLARQDLAGVESGCSDEVVFRAGVFVPDLDLEFAAGAAELQRVFPLGELAATLVRGRALLLAVKTEDAVGVHLSKRFSVPNEFGLQRLDYNT